MEIGTTLAECIAAKLLADPLRRSYGFTAPNRFASARSPIQIDAAYVIAFGASLAVVCNVGARSALPVAVLMRLGAIVAARIVLAANHSFLELFVALLCLRLIDNPAAIAPALQALTVSVWVYAAFQKIYHRQFIDGSWFYLALQDGNVLPGRPAFLPRIERMEGYYAPIQPSAQAMCGRFGRAVVIGEFLVPILGLSTSGSFSSVFLICLLTVPVGILAGETNFMITNVLLACGFIQRFDLRTLGAAVADPLVLAILAFCMFWPPIHAVLARRMQFSSWKLAGWGMYATLDPSVHIIQPDGSTVRMQPDLIHYQHWLLKAYGACRVRWVREFVWGSFFRWCHRTPTKGLVFRWQRKSGDKYVSTCVVMENRSGSRPITFDIYDERTKLEFERYVSSM